MEQLKSVMAVLKKQHFWVLCGAILVVSVASWMLAKGDLMTRFETRKKQLDSKFSDVVTIVGEAEHPNEKYLTDVQELHKNLRENVDKAWRYLYEQQRKDNPLPKVLSEGFQKSFEQFWGRPEKLDPTKDMDVTYRREYYNHIERYLPEIFRIISRRVEVEDDSGKPGTKPDIRGAETRSGQDATVKKNYVGIVDVDDTEVQRIMSGFKWAGQPLLMDVIKAQEDLWVYLALLRVIANTNKPVKDEVIDHKRANVKRLVSMQIGKDAVASWKDSMQPIARLPAAAAAEGGDQGTQPASPEPAQPAPSPGAAGAEGTAPPANRIAALAGRYWNDKASKPLEDPAQQPYDEFRMMPINLRVVMEQDAVPRLLAECANSNMPIEVRSVRLLTQQFAPLEAGGTAADAAGGGAGAASGAGPQAQGAGPSAIPSAAGGGERGTGRGAISGVLEEDCRDPKFPPVTVEVQGIIYIYNPPTINREAEAGQPAEGTAVPGAPAAPPAVAPGTAPAGTVPAPTAPGTPPAAPPGTPPTGPGASNPTLPAAKGAQP